MLDRLLVTDAAWNWFALEMAIKSTLLLLLASGIVMLLGRSSAAVRHRVWSLLFMGLLLLPLVQLVVPGLSWQIIPDRWHPAESEITAATANVDLRSSRRSMPSATEYALQASEPVTAKTDGSLAMSDAEFLSMDLAQRQAGADEGAGQALSAAHQAHDKSVAGSPGAWLPFIWLLGAGVALVPLLTGLLANLCLRHRSQPLVDSEWPRLVAALSHRLGLRRRIALLCGESQQMPMTFGLLRPCVVLPSSAEHWSAERRQIVLLHELAHIKRCDVPLQLIAWLAAALYWFHPLVWWGLRRMRLEREHACDDCVLQAGQEAPDYATQLLEIARTHCSHTPLLNAALSMARRSQLEGRLLAVLDTHRRRNSLSRVATVQLTAVTFALVACIGLVRPTLQAEPTSSTNQHDTSTVAEDPSKPATQTVLTGRVLSPDGKPVPSATVEIIGFDESRWLRSPREDTVDHFQTRADGDGRFRLVVPRNSSRPRQYTKLLASADGYGPVMQMIPSTLGLKQIEVKLHEPQFLRLQLIDAAGNPFADVQPRLWSAYGDDVELSVWHRNGHSALSGWPKFSRSDAEGFVSATLPVHAKSLVVLIEDELLGDHMVRAELSGGATGVVLKPARFLSGKVTAADTGEPLAGAEVVMMKAPYRSVRTGADGSFRIASGATIDAPYPGGRNRHIIYVYPPPDSPYLAQRSEWQGSDDEPGDGQHFVSLPRGIDVEGRVVEKRSQEPIAGATVVFEPQKANNPLFRESTGSGSTVTDMRFMTDADGRFRMPVWPGAGYLLARGPTLDYVYQEITTGDKYYGKPGLARQYHHGALRLNLETGKAPQPVIIKLERGVTLRRRVDRPDGHPAVGKAYVRSYLLHNEDIHSWLPPIAVEDGLLEVPGFEVERSKPIFIVDSEARCATVVAPAAAEIDLSSAPIQLQPCGAASFRFVMDNGSALSNYEPRLLLIVTPGAPGSLMIEPDQPLWADSIIWQNIARPAKIPKTDSDGRVTVENLIPGATYRVSFLNKEGRWDEGYEFTVRLGETTDVGEVVIPERDE